MKKLTPFRRWHRFMGVFFILPILITCVTGFFLLYRKELSFMKPQWKKVNSLELSSFASPEQIKRKIKDLDLAQKMGHIRFYPKKGIISLRLKEDREVILKGDSLEVLGRGTRYDSFFIRLHEGSYWGIWVRKYLFGPMSLALCFLGLSGGVLGFVFYKRRL